jgi:membrane protein YdbS with pleckstrin-like domain
MTVLLIALGVLALAAAAQAVRLAVTRGDWSPVLLGLGIVVVLVAIWRLGTIPSGNP